MHGARVSVELLCACASRRRVRLGRWKPPSGTVCAQANEHWQSPRPKRGIDGKDGVLSEWLHCQATWAKGKADAKWLQGVLRQRSEDQRRLNARHCCSHLCFPCAFPAAGCFLKKGFLNASQNANASRRLFTFLRLKAHLQTCSLAGFK